VTIPAPITGETGNPKMVFALPPGQFYLDVKNSCHLSGLSHLANFILTQKSYPLTGTVQKPYHRRYMLTHQNSKSREHDFFKL